MTALARRWPVHPRPGPCEALSSWLERLARCYGLSVADLLRYDLDLDPGGRQPADPGADLDWDPPAAVLGALSERTGVALDELRAMTLAGWVPWLLDTLDPHGPPLREDPSVRDTFVDEPSAAGPTVFGSYVGAHSVLLAPGEAKPRAPQQWRPWLPAQPMRRACPACAETGPDPGTMLFFQLPIMIGCPVHSCRLEPALDVRLATLAGQNPSLAYVDVHVAALDQYTHEGLSTGQVTLPRRAVHVGMWFRLLRTLLEELTAALSQVRPRSAHALRLIWATTERPARAGLSVWRPYEQLDWARQETVLEAAATALHLIETGTVTAHGTLGELLTVEPHRPVHPGTPGGRPAEPLRPAHPHDRPSAADNPWTKAMDEIAAAITAARTDPGAARQLLIMFGSFARTVATFNRLRQGLIDAGIPAQFLPDHRELGLTGLGPDNVSAEPGAPAPIRQDTGGQPMGGAS